MSDPQPADEGFVGWEPHLIVSVGKERRGEVVLHDTGIAGYWNGRNFIVPFHDEMTVEEVARIVSQALRRRAHD